MKIYQCDCCKVKVNDYSQWYDGATSRSMYELRCIHIADKNPVYDETILCHKCIEKLLYQNANKYTDMKGE